jgi:hypothetical protein
MYGNQLKIIGILLLFSCRDKAKNETATAIPVNSRFVTTTLRDSLGKVSFSIPDRYDTSFSWTNRSDCGKPCDQEQYRFQSKSFPIFKESGFFYDIPNISIDQFTIIHSSYFPFHSRSDTSKRFLRHEAFIGDLTSNLYNGKVKFDTIEKINDRYFSIVCMAGFDSARQKYFTKLVAVTTIKGNEIEFHYDSSSKEIINEKDFFDRSKEFARTISIGNGI